MGRSCIDRSSDSEACPRDVSSVISPASNRTVPSHLTRRKTYRLRGSLSFLARSSPRLSTGRFRPTSLCVCVSVLDVVLDVLDGMLDVLDVGT